MKRSIRSGWWVPLLAVGCNARDATPEEVVFPEVIEPTAVEPLPESQPEAGTPALPEPSVPDAAPEMPDAQRVAPACQLDFDPDLVLTLDASFDADQNCANGVQTDLTLYTNAPDGQSVALSVGDDEPQSAVVQDGEVTFTGVQLGAQPVTLEATLVEDSECSVRTALAVSCLTSPQCALEIADGTVMNSVPTTEGGWRASPDGAPYQTTLRVTTSLPDGELATIAVDGQDVAAGTVTDNVAELTGVLLGADGEHLITPQCIGDNGERTEGDSVSVLLDTAAPLWGPLAPVNLPAHHFSPEDDLDTQTEVLDFEVCVGGVDEPLANTDTLCVEGPDHAEVCSDVVDDGSLGRACVVLECAGSAPFELTLGVADSAGNLEHQLLTGLTCASASPTVRITNLFDASAAQTDLSLRVLSSTTQVGLPDQLPGKPGAQRDVVACTNAPVGTAQLFVGLEDEELSALGAALELQPAAAEDGCADLDYVARFPAITLPESIQAAGALTRMTELRVEVTDASTEVGHSPELRLWVDSVPPTLGVYTPRQGLCGVTFRQSEPLETSLAFTASAFPVQLGVGEDQLVSLGAHPTFPGVSDAAAVTLPLGVNEIVVSVTDAGGNVTSLSPEEPCLVTVGEPPIVTWISPTAQSALSLETDADPDVAGWQGTLEVAVTGYDTLADPKNVTFYYEDAGALVEIDSAPIIGDETSGVASAAGTVPEGLARRIFAVMDAVDVFLPQAPVLTFDVDVSTPGQAGSLAATLENRRAVSYNLRWDAPTETGTEVADYEVYWARAPITELNIDSATKVSFLGDPSADPAGTLVNNLPIETDLYFAVRAVDSAGNLGLLAVTNRAERSSLRVSVLTGPTGSRLGSWADATTDFIGGTLDPETSEWRQGDGTPDLLVSSANGWAWIYRGVPRSGPNDTSPLFESEPTVTIAGDSATLFGFRAVSIGDVNSDGLPDFAVGGLADSPSGHGATYVWFGRQPSDNSGDEWPSQLSPASADLVVQTSSDAAWAGECATCPWFSFAIERLGDFNGDSIDDFAISAYRTGTTPLEGGYVGVVLGSETLGGVLEVGSGPHLPAATGVVGISGVAVKQLLGQGVVGMGPFYGPGGNALMAASGGLERVGAFTQEQAVQRLITEPLHESVLGLQRDDYGTVMTALSGGRFLVSSPCEGMLYSCVAADGVGFVDLFYGGQDPFSASIRITDTSAQEFDFGISLQGSAMAATTGLRHFPLAGDLESSQTATDSDFAIVNHGVSAGSPATAPSIFMFSGKRVQKWISSGVTSVDVADPAQADVVIRLADKAGLDFSELWHGTAAIDMPAADLNGDGYAELLVSEMGFFNLSGDYDGRVIVLW